MDYARSLLREKNYYPDDSENIIDKWIKYKSDEKKVDLDTSLDSYYQKFWKELVKEICPRRDTMTSPLVTFEEYAFYRGLEWKNQKAHGTYTFINYLKDNVEQRDEKLGGELIEFLELATSPCNMIPVPEFFNTGRSGPYAKWDYWDLALVQIEKWFDNREKNNKTGMKDALRLLFAHSIHGYVLKSRSTNMYDSIKCTEKWLSEYESWKDFINAMYLNSFVDYNWQPILFWDTHSYELPLPTDTEFDMNEQDSEQRNNQIEQNFKQFFERVNNMLSQRADLLAKKCKEL